jgi:hypothetical protein
MKLDPKETWREFVEQIRFTEGHSNGKPEDIKEKLGQGNWFAGQDSIRPSPEHEFLLSRIGGSHSCSYECCNLLGHSAV